MDTLAQLLRDLKQLEHQRLTVGMSSSESRKLHTTEKTKCRAIEQTLEETDVWAAAAESCQASARL
jgi:hypothetical protein